MGGGHTAVAEEQSGNAEFAQLENSRKDLDDLREDPAGAGADKGEIVKQTRPEIHVGSLSLYVGWMGEYLNGGEGGHTLQADTPRF